MLERLIEWLGGEEYHVLSPEDQLRRLWLCRQMVASKVRQDLVLAEMAGQTGSATGRAVAGSLYPGKWSYPVRRLFTTEISRAFEEAGKEFDRRDPFIEGRRWNLSGHHHNADECDARSKDHSSGLPPGVYRIDEFPPLPGHPMCGCYGTGWEGPAERTAREVEGWYEAARRDGV